MSYPKREMTTCRECKHQEDIYSLMCSKCGNVRNWFDFYEEFRNCKQSVKLLTRENGMFFDSRNNLPEDIFIILNEVLVKLDRVEELLAPLVAEDI